MACSSRGSNRRLVSGSFLKVLLVGGISQQLMQKRRLKYASKWKDGVSIYEGGRDDREVRFWGSECRSLLLVTSEMPNRDQAEKMKAAGHQGPSAGCAGCAGKPGVGTCAMG